MNRKMPVATMAVRASPEDVPGSPGTKKEKPVKRRQRPIKGKPVKSKLRRPKVSIAGMRQYLSRRSLERDSGVLTVDGWNGEQPICDARAKGDKEGIG